MIVSRRVNSSAAVSLNGRSYAVPPELMRKRLSVPRIGDDVFIEYDSKLVATHTQ